MEITPELKALLQAIDPDIEDVFLNGVTQSGDFLPKLPQYDKIPPNLRPQGREGILSTFAALLNALGTYQPVENPLIFAYPFSGDGASASKNILGEIVLRGRILVSENTATRSILAVLPPGFAPSQIYTWIAATSSDAIVVFIDTNGNIYTDYNLDAGWISLDGVRFTP